MAKVELIMPKMGESIIEATILRWSKKPGDKVSTDETILEIATDKVDSEIPSPADGILKEIIYPENTVVEIGKVIAIIETEGDAVQPTPSVMPAQEAIVPSTMEKSGAEIPAYEKLTETIITSPVATSSNFAGQDSRFYSPLVKNMAREEKISAEELAGIPGTGSNGRVTKTDMMQYLQDRNKLGNVSSQPPATVLTSPQKQMESNQIQAAGISLSGQGEIIEMDRMRRLIADHMVMSKQTSPHVTSFVESDVTNMVLWRERNKKKFQEKYGENITFTPLFIEAVVKALKDFPMVNISLNGYQIIKKKDINIGMAAALPSGNLIVPVIKNADMLNLIGLTKNVNDLARRARENKLKPEEIQDGTFTITNVGTFGNIMGTPIINQPQVAILATGTIIKKPAVLETEHGDVIAIRHMMFLSLSYDHRVVDGSLGGAFLKKISDYMEKFDIHREI